MIQSRIHRMHRSTCRHWRAIGLGLLLLPAATTQAQQPDIGAITQREVALLEFYGGGSPLSAQERQEAADMVQREMDRAPQAERAADAGAAKLLGALRQGSPQLIALAREGGRLNVELHNAVAPELQEQQAMEARIIAAHDRVVVFDAAHKRLISEQTVRILQHANTFGATVFDVPPPGVDFAGQMEDALRRAYPTMDDGMQDAMAHAERDLPYAPGFLQNINQQKRAGFVQTYRAKILAAPDPTDQQLNLAEVMAVVGKTASRQRQSGGGQSSGALASRLQMQDLTTRKLQESMRSFSPICNVTRPDAMANFASCHP
jgi:hypothetical protein